MARNCATLVCDPRGNAFSMSKPKQRSRRFSQELRAMLRYAAREDLARGDVQGGEEVERPVRKIVMRASLRLDALSAARSSVDIPQRDVLELHH